MEISYNEIENKVYFTMEYRGNKYFSEGHNIDYEYFGDIRDFKDFALSSFTHKKINLEGNTLTLTYTIKVLKKVVEFIYTLQKREYSVEEKLGMLTEDLNKVLIEIDDMKKKVNLIPDKEYVDDKLKKIAGDNVVTLDTKLKKFKEGFQHILTEEVTKRFQELEFLKKYSYITVDGLNFPVNINATKLLLIHESTNTKIQYPGFSHYYDEIPIPSNTSIKQIGLLKQLKSLVISFVVIDKIALSKEKENFIDRFLHTKVATKSNEYNWINSTEAGVNKSTITDLTPLSSLPLENLEIYGLSLLENIKPLDEIKTLTNVIILNCPKLKDYRPLTKLPNLKEVTLSRNENPSGIPPCFANFPNITVRLI